MTLHRRRGSGIVVAIMALSLVAGALFVLAGTSRAMLFEANRAHVEAMSYNLAASALAWARRNPASRGAVKLDVAALSVPNAAVTVELSDGADGKTTVLIHTECRRVRMTVRRSESFVIDQAARLSPLRD